MGPCVYAQEASGKSVPQDNEEAPSTPSSGNKGGDYATTRGDKDIYTNVPNPNPGNEKEVIKPPETPNVEPR
jgi:hypothetical protein